MTIPYLPWVTLNNESLWQTTLPSISLIGRAAFKWLIDVGEEVYTINIQHQAIIKISRPYVLLATPLLPQWLYTLSPYPTDEAELFAKSSPKVHQYFFDVFSCRIGLRTCLRIASLP